MISTNRSGAASLLWWRARNPQASPEGLLTLGIIYQVVMIPAPLERVVMACLEKDPDRRPRSARELLGMLIDDNGWNQERARTWWEMHVPGR